MVVLVDCDQYLCYNKNTKWVRLWKMQKSDFSTWTKLYPL